MNNKLHYLKTGKQFLRKVARYRCGLQQHGVGYVPPALRNEPQTILYHLPAIVSSDQLQRYIQRKQDAIRMLIPANKKKWSDEFRELMEADV